MATKPTITVDIELGGATKISVQGHAGPGCTKLTEAIEKALGKTVSSCKTPEYNKQAQAAHQAKAGA